MASDRDALARNLWGEEAPLPDEALEDEDAPLNPTTGDSPMAPDQLAMFDLATVTERAPDADILERLDAEGLTAGARKRIFEAATIKQVVAYFPLDAYRDFLERMAHVMQASGTKDHTHAMIYLLEHWEQTHATAHAG